MRFVFDGKRYSLTKQEVEARMRGVEPDRIYQYAMEVNGVRYPVKQVFRVATGEQQVNTDRARNILRRLGFVDQDTVDATDSPCVVIAPSPKWVLEVQTVTGGLYTIELDQEKDAQALKAEISHWIGSNECYQGRSRRIDAVGGVGMVTIAWKHVAAASIYQPQDRPAA